MVRLPTTCTVWCRVARPLIWRAWNKAPMWFHLHEIIPQPLYFFSPVARSSSWNNAKPKMPQHHPKNRTKPKLWCISPSSTPNRHHDGPGNFRFWQLIKFRAPTHTQAHTDKALCGALVVGGGRGAFVCNLILHNALFRDQMEEVGAVCKWCALLWFRKWANPSLFGVWTVGWKMKLTGSPIIVSGNALF